MRSGNPHCPHDCWFWITLTQPDKTKNVKKNLTPGLIRNEQEKPLRLCHNNNESQQWYCCCKHFPLSLHINMNFWCPVKYLLVCSCICILNILLFLRQNLLERWQKVMPNMKRWMLKPSLLIYLIILYFLIFNYKCFFSTRHNSFSVLGNCMSCFDGELYVLIKKEAFKPVSRNSSLICNPNKDKLKMLQLSTLLK